MINVGDFDEDLVITSNDLVFLQAHINNVPGYELDDDYVLNLAMRNPNYIIDVSDVITEFKCIGLIMPPEDLAEFFNKHILLDKKKARQTERYPVKEMLETRKSNTSKTAEKNLIDNYISFFEKILIQFHERT